MKLTLQHYLIIAVAILAVATGISTYRLIKVSERSKSLEASQRILEADLMKEQEHLKKVDDTLKNEIHYLNEYNADLLAEIEDIRKTKADRKSKKDEKDTDIDRIHAVDAIYSEVARHYR